MKIFQTQDGSHSIFSDEHGVSYHSKYGAIQEAKHVFIDAGLRPKAVIQRKISVLEIGLGTGLNALVTYQEACKRNLSIYYTGVENFPISIEEAQLLNYPSELDLDELGTQFFLDIHRCPWNIQTRLHDQFRLTKRHQLFQNIEFKNEFDVIYFDAFAPNAQPELWEKPMFTKMYEALKEDGVLVTYCAKGVVKRCLKSVGFVIESLKGPPGKREMTRARKVLES